MDISFQCEPVVSPLGYGMNLVENDAAHNPHSSLSAKIKMPHSPCSSESDSISSTSARTRFTPIRKMFDPFLKSSSIENTRRNKTSRKSLLHDFSRSPQNTKLDSDFVEKDSVSSPVHLHGCLKLGAKHGVPSFEFSMNEPEVFLTKTSNADNAFSWVYTFHLVDKKKTSNTSIPEPSDHSKAAASIVPQMQVSCRLCSEIKDGEDVEKSMVTEFVLYDTTRARQHVTVLRSTDDRSNVVVRLKDHLNLSLENDEVEFLNGTRADLHPNLEITSIVVQIGGGSAEAAIAVAGTWPVLL
ncbi:hypothetical protein F3Y22_tig00111841pilonHSYRG00278 [Hibiscus syriacus]|uniref:Uncharacterized protein n=1 Tax=Hibiscus syriacus TaxID=106335 RepID=A0A6A2YEA5_HIBSY|nr:hypothetical protein F3Y22_tig00111841pilonHSYRG00278 [Hibiscus syriacus]